MIKNKKVITIIIIIAIGCLFRIVGISKYPNALNADEASSGYESYSIGTYGIDRNGHKLPVFLESWGSGQNALLSYMAIPFVKILGLNALSIRLPMAIIGCISLVVFYLLLRRLFNEKVAFLGLFFLIICPWHLMKSRWGLESNLFPDLILYFTYFLVKGLQDKNKKLLYFSFVFPGLSSYAYGTSYMFLPLFIIPILIVLKVKKEIDIKDFIISLGIVTAISLPIILFVIINTFNLGELRFLCFTIPYLPSNRYKLITSFFSGNFIGTTLTNLITTIKILIVQYDDLGWNSLKSFGTIYLFSTVFTFIGLLNPLIDKYINKKKNGKALIETKSNYTWIFKIWFIAAFLVSLVSEPNINRLNIIMFPIIFYTVLGIYYFCQYKNIMASIIFVIYLFYFGLFSGAYLSQDWNYYYTFEKGLSQVFDYANELKSKNENINFVITDSIKDPYIFTLFYTKYNTIDFHNSVKYTEGHENDAFRPVDSFGNYYFGTTPIDQENTVFIFKKHEADNFYTSLFDIKEINDYVILSPKNPQLTQ